MPYTTVIRLPVVVGNPANGFPARLLAPHHDPQVHGHIVAGLAVGEICETFPSADRDPIWEELFTVRPEIVGGRMQLLDGPGWGIELDERTLERRGVWA